MGEDGVCRTREKPGVVEGAIRFDEVERAPGVLLSKSWQEASGIGITDQ